MVQLSHPYMTVGKTIALTRWTFVDKVMSLLFNMLSRLVITFCNWELVINQESSRTGSVWREKNTVEGIEAEQLTCRQ